MQFLTANEQHQLRMLALDRADSATRVACEAIQGLRRHGIPLSELSLASLLWAEEHAKQDADRRLLEQAEIAQEALRLSGLAKLTEAEQKALGVCPHLPG